jgi:membrane-associated protease RseP (regulator of RpoE activity)
MSAMGISHRSMPPPPPAAVPVPPPLAGDSRPLAEPGAQPATPLEPEAQAGPSPVQIGLFLVTLLSTLVVGAFHEGANPLASPAALVRGIPFAVTLLGILLVHEMGHFLAARRAGVAVTFPYFLPAPTLLGTLGAFIRIRSQVTDRRALLTIGAAGPIAGFLVALPAVWIGVATSHLALVPGEGAIQLGDSLLMKAVVRAVHGAIPAGHDLMLNSVGLAAWAGILVTALNLLPIGQLDGGHVAYALLGARSRWVALAAIGGMLYLAREWPGWYAWCVLPLIFGFRHPPLLDPERPLRRRDRLVGLVAFGLLIVCFIPVPLRLNP